MHQLSTNCVKCGWGWLDSGLWLWALSSHRFHGTVSSGEARNACGVDNLASAIFVAGLWYVDNVETVITHTPDKIQHRLYSPNMTVSLKLRMMLANSWFCTHNCSSSAFLCVGMRMIYWSLRSTVTFVICFHWSLLLAFSLHFSFSDLFSHSPPILAVVYLVFWNLLASLSRLFGSLKYHLSFGTCVQPISPGS